MSLKLLLVLQIVITNIKMNKLHKNDTKINGGNWSDIESHPYMAAVVIQSRFYCGGTILSHNHILTAAHCISICPTDNLRKVMCHSGHPSDYHVITGNTILIDVDNIETNVLRVLLHPLYALSKNGCTYVNDLGILYIKSHLSFNEQIQPVKLQPLRYTKQQRRTMTHKMGEEGKECIALGWGIKKRPVGTVSNHGRYLKNDEIFHYLKKSIVTIAPNNVCNSILIENNSTLTCEESHICALHDTSSFCIEDEDAGGPLMCDGLELAVISRAGGCGNGFSPIILTPLDKNVEWIRKTYEEEIVNHVGHFSSATVLNLSSRFLLSIYCMKILFDFEMSYNFTEI